MSPSLLYSEASGIARLTLNRPQRLNAFDLSLARELLNRLEEISHRSDLRVVILSGRGKGFCAGVDLSELKRLREELQAEPLRELVLTGKEIFLRLREMPQIVVAAVNGPAAGGGCSLALACDWRISSQDALFIQAFVKVGMQPDWGGYWTLPRLVGPQKAFELMAMGRSISAPEALDLGLVNEVVPPEALERRSTGVAEELCRRAPLALRKIKRGIHLSQTAACLEVLDYEIEAQVECFESRDAEEGLNAFLEKRPPRFTGK